MFIVMADSVSIAAGIAVANLKLASLLNAGWMVGHEHLMGWPLWPSGCFREESNPRYNGDDTVHVVRAAWTPPPI